MPEPLPQPKNRQKNKPPPRCAPPRNSSHERLAHDILARLEEHSKTYSDRNQDKNLALHRDILATLEQAHSELDSASQKQLAELLPYKKLESTCKGFYSGKKEKDIKQVLQKLRGA